MGKQQDSSVNNAAGSNAGGVATATGEDIRNCAMVEMNRLSRRFLMSLPENAYVFSNVCHHDAMPLYADTIVGFDERRHQWDQIKACRASGRMCHVFSSEEEGRAFLAALRLKYGFQ